MTGWKIGVSLAAACALLSGCMTGGASGSAAGAVPPPAATPQENGLPYAAMGQSLDDVEGVAVMAAASSFSDIDGTSAETLQITLGAGFFAGSATERDAVATFFGEEVTITDGEGTLSNGQTVRLIFDPAAAGDYAGTVQLVSYAALENPAPPDPVNGEAHYVFGFLTDPAQVDARVSGNVSYSGDIAATGLVRVNGTGAGDPGGTELDGTIAMVVDFGNDVMSGSLNANYMVDAQRVDVDLSLAEMAFAGNGMAGNLTCAGMPGCTSSSSINAGFYGPNGGEMAGTLSIDTSHDLDGDAYNFEGAGSFVIVPGGP